MKGLSAFARCVFAVAPLLFLRVTWADEPTHCPAGVIAPERSEATRLLREKYFSACLTCEGTRCKFRRFTEEEDVFAKQCPVLFCTPVSIGRTALLPEDANDEGQFTFTHAIDTNGRVTDIEVTSIVGNADSQVAKKLIKNAFGRLLSAAHRQAVSTCFSA